MTVFRTAKIEKYFKAVPEIRLFFKEKVRDFSRSMVSSNTVLTAIILPGATKLNDLSFSHCWVIAIYTDRTDLNQTQKLSVFGIKEAGFVAINIPNQGTYVLSYNGKDIRFQAKKDFNEETFIKESSENSEARHMQEFREEREKLQREKEKREKELEAIRSVSSIPEELVLEA